MKRVALAMFPNPDKGEPIQRRLVQAGIPAELHDELRLEKLWFVSKPSACVRLEVPTEQFERAHSLLLDWDNTEGALRDAIRCSECKSLRVAYPQFTRKSFLPNLVMGLGVVVGVVEKDYYCEDCHYTWPKEGHQASTLRPHMAPYYFIEGVEQTTLVEPKLDEIHR